MSLKGNREVHRDPVCGMEAGSAVKLEYRGKTIFFCSKHCAETFQKEPERYAETEAVEECSCRHHLPKHGSTNATVPYTTGAAHFHPMCPEVESDRPGPKCGMALKQNPAFVSIRHYTCPMHPEVRLDRPGSCPKCGMALESVEPDIGKENVELRDMTKRLWISALFAVPVLVLAMGEMIPGLDKIIESIGSQTSLWIQFALATPVFLWGGFPFLQRAWKSILHHSPNMFTLIALGTSAAYLLSLVQLFFVRDPGRNHAVPTYFEAAAVITVLALLGQVLELKARAGTRAAIRSLLTLTPKIARRLQGDKEEEIPLENVARNDILRVRPGDRIPVDGVIYEGSSTINESMVTGEAMPMIKKVGDPVIGGTINGVGSFLMRAERVGSETMLAQIINLVTQAQRSKAPLQRVTDRVAAWFVPVVLIISVLTFITWWMFSPEPHLAFAFTAGVSVLIISCPCALGLATPMSIMMGIGRGAQLGILIRDAGVLEKLEKINTVVFDKTGTLTEGKPTVTEVVTFKPFDQHEVLQLAAAAETQSEHPIARAIVHAATGQLLPKASSFSTDVGSGIRAEVDGKRIYVGKLSAQEQDGTVARQIADRWRMEGKTVVIVYINEEPAGLLAITDCLKSTSTAAVKQLHKWKLKTVMLTGDNQLTARFIANAAEIDEVISEASPTQKQAAITKLQKTGGKVAMVGDGINDAPALAAADVGIAMGTGTEVSMESAGVTLVKGDLRALVSAIALSHTTMKNVRQNLFFAFIYNSVGIPIAAGLLYPIFHLLLNPMLASLAMSLSSVSVIANALRLRTVANRQTFHQS